MSSALSCLPKTPPSYLQALRAARNDLEHPHDQPDDVSAETRIEELRREDEANGVSFSSDVPPESRMETARDLADALVQVCAGYLNAKAATAENPDTYQVIIHAGVQAISGDLATEDVSAETPEGAAGTLPVSHPAHPMRCHIQDGLALSLSTLALISCNATISTMIHDAAGAILDVGRRTRKPPPALRRAIRERDGYRCQFPGCHSRRTDAHHIVHWANGGETKLGNLISLCKRHHTLVHDKGYLIASTPGGFTFYSPQGTPMPACPKLRAGPGDITTTHDAVITPATIIPPNSGGRLDLNLAIWITFANARVKTERREREQASPAA
jgi:HNH endonuclease